MKIARVIGTVVATQKDAKLAGAKLLLVREVDVESGQLVGTALVAIDTVGAGVGALVLTVGGSSARLTEATRQAPVDAAIVGLVDAIEQA